MLTQYTAKVDVVIFFHFGPVTHCAKSFLKTHKHMLSENCLFTAKIAWNSERSKNWLIIALVRFLPLVIDHSPGYKS